MSNPYQSLSSQFQHLEVETGESDIQDSARLYSQLQISLGCIFYLDIA